MRKPLLLVKWIYLPICLVTVGCGYRFQHHAKESDPVTIHVRMVKRDQEGLLTQAIVRSISSSGQFICVHKDGDLELHVKVLDRTNDHVGYQYDQQPTVNQLEKRLLPTEDRETIEVELTVVHRATQKTLLGPLQIKASQVYDYVTANALNELSFIDTAGVRQTVQRFSLGQLDSWEGAQDEALVPVMQKIAHQITQLLINKKYVFEETVLPPAPTETP